MRPTPARHDPLTVLHLHRHGPIHAHRVGLAPLLSPHLFTIADASDAQSEMLRSPRGCSRQAARCWPSQGERTVLRGQARHLTCTRTRSRTPNTRTHPIFILDVNLYTALPQRSLDSGCCHRGCGRGRSRGCSRGRPWRCPWWSLRYCRNRGHDQASHVVQLYSHLPDDSQVYSVELWCQSLPLTAGASSIHAVWVATSVHHGVRSSDRCCTARSGRG